MDTLLTWYFYIQNVLVGLEMHQSFIFQVPNCLGSHKDVCRIATAMGCATLNAPMFGFGFLLYQSTLCWIFFRLAYALTHLTGFSSIQNYWTPVIPKKGDPSLRCTGEGINTHLHWVCKICHTNSAARNNFFLSKNGHYQDISTKYRCQKTVLSIFLYQETIVNYELK